MVESSPTATATADGALLYESHSRQSFPLHPRRGARGHRRALGVPWDRSIPTSVDVRHSAVVMAHDPLAGMPHRSRTLFVDERR